MSHFSILLGMREKKYHLFFKIRVFCVAKYPFSHFKNYRSPSFKKYCSACSAKYGFAHFVKYSFACFPNQHPAKCLCSTPGGVQYTGCAVHQGVCSTLGVQYTRGYHEYSGGYHEYTGATTSTVGIP